MTFGSVPMTLPALPLSSGTLDWSWTTISRTGTRLNRITWATSALSTATARTSMLERVGSGQTTPATNLSALCVKCHSVDLVCLVGQIRTKNAAKSPFSDSDPTACDTSGGDPEFCFLYGPSGTFDESLAFCRGLGGRLAEFVTQEENDFAYDNQVGVRIYLKPLKLS